MRFFLILICLTFSSFAESDINLTAENGLELNQAKKTITALKNAKIENGDITLTADKIIAFYKQVGKKQEVYKIEAYGDVSVVSSKEKVETKKAVYNLSTGIMELTGSPLTRLYYDDIVLSSPNTIIYNHIKGIANVKDGTIKQQGRILTCPKMDAYFEKINNKFSLSKADCLNGVNLKTESETLTGDNAVYNAKTGFARITNSVSIKKEGQANLEGGELEYNLKTGITRLYPKKGEDKVSGTFITNKETNILPMKE